MKNIIAFVFSILLMISGMIEVQAQSNKSFISNSLKNKWSTEKLLSIPESVLFNDKLDIFYVSNINGNPDEKDGNGFISKISNDGSINLLKWVNGLNAPKGMGISGDKLYVADIDELIEIDITSGKILKRYPAKKAKFLNDVAVDKKGNVYVSDSQRNLIYCLRKDNLDIWLSVGNLFNPNGLLIDNNELLVGCNNYIISVNLDTKHVRTFIIETGSVDGLVKIDNEHFVISDWAGNIYLLTKTEPKVKLLCTEPENINAADIEYNPAEKLLLVPTFGDNRIMAYELNI